MPLSAAISDRVARIAKKVRDRGVRLGAVLGDEKVRRFEQLHGISLPEGFRSFLMEVGNGGSGPPNYGLAALGEPARDMRDEEARVWSELPHVRKPFPFTKLWVWEDGDFSEEGTSGQIHYGCIYVGNDGCGA